MSIQAAVDAYRRSQSYRRDQERKRSEDQVLADRVGLGDTSGDRYGQLPSRRPDSIVGGTIYDQIRRDTGRAQERLYNQDLPGEDEYYKRQYGDIARVIQARQDAANSSMREALNSRGVLNSTIADDEYANLNRQAGSELRSALGNVQDARFAARERRIGDMRARDAQSAQAQKNFEYQLFLLREQLKRQGKSDVLPYIENLFSNLAGFLPSGGGDDPYAVTGSRPYEDRGY